jgi:hypothetical protein
MKYQGKNVMKNLSATDEQMNRQKIAEELMDSCPDDLAADHQVIADAITAGCSIDYILGMTETNAWPDTYVFLRSRFQDMMEVTK